MKPRITCCRRNFRPRQRRSRSRAQAAASAVVGLRRMVLAKAIFMERFRTLSRTTECESILGVVAPGRVPVSPARSLFSSPPFLFPLSTNVERGPGGEAKRGEGARWMSLKVESGPGAEAEHGERVRG